MDRRKFISTSGVALGVSTILPLSGRNLIRSKVEGDWESVRAEFDLTREGIQMAQFLLASHPKSVRKAIDKHRTQLDLDPSEYWHDERRK